MKKKVFLVAKVYEMEPATLMSVQQEIQDVFDRIRITEEEEERRVVFSACNPSDNEFEFTFNRTSLQNLVEEAKINSADADTITGTGLNGFRMPEPYPSAPFGSYFKNHIQAHRSEVISTHSSKLTILLKATKSLQGCWAQAG